MTIHPLATGPLAAGNRLLAANPLLVPLPGLGGRTLDIEEHLRAWIEARVPELAGRVHPHQEGFQKAAPYCLYSRVSGERLRDQHGPNGVSAVRVQVDVWSDRRRQARQLADRIAGTKGDRGLDGFRGRLLPGIDGWCVVVQAAHEVGQFEDGDGPLHTADAGWFVASRDYRIGFEELLRAAP